MSVSLPGNSPPVDCSYQTSGRVRRGGEREVSVILPLELWEQILVRSPVRTLLNLKSVSKSFLSLIQNPNFTSLHFNHFNNYSSDLNGSRLILVEDDDEGRFVICRSDTTLTKTTEFQVPVNCVVDCYILGYLNGLLLIERWYACEASDYTLWNHSLGKSMMIPTPPSYNKGFDKWDLGYDPASDDYKILVIVYDHDQPSTYVEVYSLRTGSWKIIGKDVIAHHWFLGNSVYNNGFIHWIAGDYSNEDHNNPDIHQLHHVVLFDLGTELFRYIKLPDIGEDGVVIDRVRFPLLLGGFLAVLCISDCEICIWVMRDNGWTKECTMEAANELFDFLHEFARYITNVMFFEKSGDLVISVHCHVMLSNLSLILYNTNTKQIRQCEERIIYADRFVENLLWRELMPPEDIHMNAQHSSSGMQGREGGNNH